jgi:hypothetical protein
VERDSQSSRGQTGALHGQRYASGVVVETITDLGVPTLIGAALGAVISHYAAKARGREEHERTVDLIVTQDERRTAQAMLDSVRQIKNAINAGRKSSQCTCRTC